MFRTSGFCLVSTFKIIRYGLRILRGCSIAGRGVYMYVMYPGTRTIGGVAPFSAIWAARRLGSYQRWMFRLYIARRRLSLHRPVSLGADLPPGETISRNIPRSSYFRRMLRWPQLGCSFAMTTPREFSLLPKRQEDTRRF